MCTFYNKIYISLCQLSSDWLEVCTQYKFPVHISKKITFLSWMGNYYGSLCRKHSDLSALLSMSFFCFRTSVWGKCLWYRAKRREGSLHSLFNQKGCSLPLQHTKIAHYKESDFISRKGHTEAGRDLVWGGGLDQWLYDRRSGSSWPCLPWDVYSDLVKTLK